jgi:hypothetical protein
VNGYSGFVPGSYAGIAAALRGFPDDRSRAELQRLGVSHVVVHLDAYGDLAGALVASVSAAPWLALVAAGNQIRIYRLVTS